MILDIFDLQVHSILPNQVLRIGLLVQEKKPKEDFQDGHLGFSTGMILAIFVLHVAQIHPTKFRVNWLFCPGEALNRFSRQTWWPSWILDQKDFSYFLSACCPDATY